MKKVLLMSLLSFSLSALAVDFVKQKPMDKVVGSTVENCTGNEKTLPVITWGGDIATVYANGNKLNTTNDSIFGKKGLNFKIKREDVFSQQVKNYMSCKSPFLRGTMGMINVAASVTEKDARTKMVIVYQLTWSVGADVLVVKNGIKRAKDLKGKTIAVQADGPHLDYLLTVLKTAGLKASDVNIVYVKDLTGDSGQTPADALTKSNVHAAMMISPDAYAVTSGDTVGTGGEGSIKGARKLLSTKTADTVISDVYAVRSDYFNANKDKVFKMVHGLIEAQAEMRDLFKTKSNKKLYNKTVTSTSKILLDSEHAGEDLVAMYSEAKFVGLSGNEKFFTNKQRRSFKRLQKEIQASYVSHGYTKKKHTVATAQWTYKDFRTGKLTQEQVVETPMFNADKVEALIKKKVETGTLSEGELFSFEIFFSPGQSTFPSSKYKKAFEKAIDLAATYGGAIVTVEGHVDQMQYLKNKFGSKKSGLSPQGPLVLNKVKQSAKNLSLQRSNAVQDSLIRYAKQSGVTLDTSKFSTVGHGITCESKSCAPKTKSQWAEQRRVKFRIIQVEAESDTFSPLD